MLWMQCNLPTPDLAGLRGVRGRAVAHLMEAAAEKRGGPLMIQTLNEYEANQVILQKVNLISIPIFYSIGVSKSLLLVP